MLSPSIIWVTSFVFRRGKSTKDWIKFPETCVSDLLLQKISKSIRLKQNERINSHKSCCTLCCDMHLKRSNVSCMNIYCLFFASVLSLSISIHLIALAAVAGKKFPHFNVATTGKERWDLSTNNSILLMAAIVGKMSALWAVVLVLSFGPAFICLC